MQGKYSLPPNTTFSLLKSTMAMHECCVCGDVTGVRHLLDAGHDPNDVSDDWNGCAPIHMAAQGKDDDAAAMITHMLLERGAYADSKCTKNRRTPLYYASQNGLLSTVKTLLHKNANPNARNDEFGETALTAACVAGNLAMVEALVVCGADVNLGDRAGQTPLIWAIYDQPKLDVMKRLIELGADVNKGGYGRPLNWALDVQSPQAVKMLLEAGADPRKDSSGFGRPSKQSPRNKEIRGLISSALRDIECAENGGTD
eukprot:ANDGO_00433.mRNA.1 Putative ankyrin repeat protein RF_0381